MSESEPRTQVSGHAAIEKTGDCPKRRARRDVLSMTYGRRGGLSQGFFTDPQVSGHCEADGQMRQMGR